MKTPPPILLHINYFEENYLELAQSLETVFKKTRALGADGLELRLNESHFAGPAYWESVIAAQEKVPLAHLSLVTILKLTAPDADVRRTSVDEWIRALEFLAPRLPLSVLNIQTGRLEDKTASPHEYEKHGSRLQTEELFQTQVAGLKEAVARVEPLGIRLALETHQGFCHDLAEPAAALVDAVGSPHLGVLLDYGNLIGFQPMPSLEKTIRTLGARITSLHLKNSFLTGLRPAVRCGLADGAINHRRYLELVRQHTGTIPPICIEAPRPGDREHFAAEDLAYIRNLRNALFDSV